MTIQAAIVSEDTFALDSRNLYLPGLITYEDGPAGSFVLTVTPIGSTDLKIGVIEVIIGSADLQALRAMRDQHTDDDIPELSTLSTNCYDCRTNGERLATIERRQERDAELTAALRLAREYVVKGNEQGAYTGCALSGETVLARIDWATGR